MNPSTNDIERIEEEIKNLEISDPRLILQDSGFYLLPYYWNYSFLSTFYIPFLLFFLKLFSKELKYDLLFLGGVLGGIYIFYIQLIFYNTVKFDLDLRIVTITPPLVLKFIKRKKSIPFKKITSLDFREYGFWASDKRYVLIINDKEDNTIDLISTSNEKDVVDLLKLLRLLTR